MYIYVKKTPATESQLRTLGDELYSGAHADKGLTDFHYAFTPFTRVYEEDCSEINFEVLGTDKQIAFLKMIDADFDIIRIEPAEDGEEEERQAINWWRKTHKDSALPKQIRARGKRLEELHELIRRNNLYMSYYFCFMEEAEARKVYDSLRSGDYWLPMKCAVALRKAEVFYPYWVVLYIGEPVYIVELPKPEDVAWYWSEYLTKMALPKQDEFDDCKTDQKFWYNERVASLLDYFISPSLEKGIYECLVCHEAFSVHDDLMDHLRHSGHGDQFNAIIIDRFYVIARAAATEALGKIGEAVDPLIQALKDENVYIRRGAAEALGKIGDARAVEPLIRAWNTASLTYGVDKDEALSRHAAEALVKIGGPAVEPLIQHLKKQKEFKNWDTRRGAAEILGKIGDARAVEPLTKALKDPNEYVQTSAKWALDKIKAKKSQR